MNSDSIISSSDVMECKKSECHIICRLLCFIYITVYPLFHNSCSWIHRLSFTISTMSCYEMCCFVSPECLCIDHYTCFVRNDEIKISNQSCTNKKLLRVTSEYNSNAETRGKPSTKSLLWVFAWQNAPLRCCQGCLLRVSEVWLTGA